MVVVLGLGDNPSRRSPAEEVSSRRGAADCEGGATGHLTSRGRRRTALVVGGWWRVVAAGAREWCGREQRGVVALLLGEP